MSNSAITGPVFSDVRRSPSGSAAAPSWSFAESTGTGVYLVSAGVLGLSTNGVQRVVVDAAGNVGVGVSSPKASVHSSGNVVLNNGAGFLGNLYYSGTWKYASSGSALAFAMYSETSGLVFSTAPGGGAADATATLTERMRIDSSGNVGIGTESPSSLGGSITTVELKGKLPNRGGGIRMSSSDSSLDGALYAADGIIHMGALTSHSVDFVTQNVTRMRIHTDGNVLVNTGLIGAVGTYSTATGSGANVHVLSNGYMLRSTSSLKYKKEIKNATHGLADLLKLRSVTYENKSDIDKGQVFGGLIAEEVHDAGMTEFVQYAEDGSPDAISYGNMVSLCIKAIQEQQEIIGKLEARLAALESK